MKYTLTLLLSTLLFSNQSKAQNDVLLSGNSSSSAMICSSGKIWTWGSNRVMLSNTYYYGLLAQGNTSSPFIATPTQVVGNSTFNTLQFRQVSAGSGNHFVALACDSTVWAWGFNGKGQVGNGTSGTVVDVPAQIKAGVLTGTSYDDGKGFLKGVKVVHAANNNTFAILRDGRLISWGGNSATFNSPYDDAHGQLGDDTQVDKLTPVFVLNGDTKQPLSSVKNVSSGDNAVYALIDEDKDGKGTVYSWGNGLNGTLGRNTNGTAGNPGNNTSSVTSVTTISTTAFPVRFINGNSLDNIVSIAAGDGFGLALDVNGSVWAWGNGTWGGTTGQGVLQNHADPKKVVKGTVKGRGTDLNNIYLKAKSIAGGQGFAMAITEDGKPVSWGNNSGCTGGILGNGIPTGSISYNASPSYIINSTNTVDSNVIAIYRGDTWGFYVTNENKVMTWGCNENGQLGLGNTTLQLKAVQLAEPSTCGFRAIRPFVNFNTRDTNVCNSKLANTPFTIRSGFDLAPALSADYQISWYRNGSLIKGPLVASGTNLNLTVSSTGTYKAVIHYIGSKSGCTGYEDASQQITVSAFASTYTTPNDLIYEKDTLKPYVIPVQPSVNPKYVWFATASSTAPLDTTIGAQKGAIFKKAPGIIEGIEGAITLYVEEKANFSGTVFRKNQSCNPLFNQYDVVANNSPSTTLIQTQFTAYQTLKITEFKVMLKTSIFQPGQTISGNLHFAVYGAKKNEYSQWIPDATKKYGAVIKAFSITRSAAAPMDITQELIVALNSQIIANREGNVFFISAEPIALTEATNTGVVLLGRAGCAQTGVPLFDNVLGKTVAFTGTCFGFNNPEPTTSGGNIFDIKFETSQEFCERLAVTLNPKIITKLSEESHSSNTLKLYPNPSKGTVSIRVEKEGVIRILTLQGLEVLRGTVVKGINTISLENIPKSTYVVEFSGLDMIQRTKLVLE